MDTAHVLAKWIKRALWVAWACSVLSAIMFFGSIPYSSTDAEVMLGAGVDVFFFAFWVGIIATVVGFVLRGQKAEISWSWLCAGVAHVVCSLSVMGLTLYILTHHK